VMATSFPSRRTVLNEPRSQLKARSPDVYDPHARDDNINA
jgi:hypothetical protein